MDKRKQKTHCDLCSSSGRLSSVDCYFNEPVEGQNTTIWKILSGIMDGATLAISANKEHLRQLQLCLGCQTQILNAYKVHKKIRKYLTKGSKTAASSPKKVSWSVHGFCFVCNEVFRDKAEERDHEERNHPQHHKWFRCTVCKDILPTAEKAIEHRRMIHELKKAHFICGICNKECKNRNGPENIIQYSRVKAIYEHIQEVHREPFVPKGIKRTMEQSESSKREPLGESLGETSKTTIMPIASSSNDPEEPSSSNHADNNPPDNSTVNIIYNCPKCSETIESDQGLLCHLAHVHNEYSLTCDDCGTSFNRLDALKNHRIEHKHETQEFSYLDEPVSEAIPSNLPNESFLKYTIVTRTNKDGASEKRFKCSMCKEAFIRKINFHKHSCAHFSDTPNLKIKCRACDDVFPTVKDMYTHMEVHNSKDAMSCILCDKFFMTIAGLKYHLKTHTGMKSFKCPFCMKKFTAAVNLRIHLRQMHSVPKGHTCPICSKSYDKKGSLHKHMNTHGERKFKCSFCTKAFRQRSHLSEHEHTHKGTLFSCDRCGIAYMRKSSLRKHVAFCSTLK